MTPTEFVKDPPWAGADAGVRRLDIDLPCDDQI